jgi:hypothetical protein
MGAWGTGPFDNDDAADFIGDVLMRPVDGVNSNSRGRSYELARCVAALVLVSHGTDILGGPGLTPVLRALTRIRSDEDWLRQWNSPRRAAQAVNKQIVDVIERMRTCKGCRRATDNKTGEQTTALKEAKALPAPKPPRFLRKPRVAIRAYAARAKRT